jgi:8-oxo-dGTP pyrophosphatase MutT (NUDIX family)
VLDLDMSRAGAAPRDAATLVVVRDAQAPAERGVEVFCVQRQPGGFLGGAIVFPGGKVEPEDADRVWEERATAPRARGSVMAPDEAASRALAVAACREALEEAAILPVAGAALGHVELLEWRGWLHRREHTLPGLLGARGARLDLGALHPLARWITPAGEARRYDARFYLFVAGGALTGAHDDRETTASFWSAPAEVLRRFAAGSLQLAPPTHRTLEVLARARDAADAVAIAGASCLDAICPRLVAHRDARGETVALVLPGDPEHDLREARSPGASRYVLRGDRFLPEDPPG